MKTKPKLSWEQLAAKRRKLAEQPFTAEEKARWAPMLHATWQTIGGDAEHAMQEAGQRLTKAIIVEFVVDANRVQEFGGMTDDEYAFLCAVYDRPTVKRWLYKELNY
jgi:hypothetical protein